jgi:hypothetical protein
VVCGLLMMIAGDAAPYQPAQSASALVVYGRRHLSGPEICRFGLWMTLVAYLVVLVVALSYRAAVGEPLVIRAGERAGGLRGDSRVDKAVKVCISQVSSRVVASCDRQKAWQVFGTLVQ